MNAIPGVGAARLDKYGAAFLAALKNVARASGPEPETLLPSHHVRSSKQ